MVKKFVLATFAAGLAFLALPSTLNAYGAYHYSYSRYGYGGMYRGGATYSRGYGAYGTHYYAGYNSGQLYAPSHAAGYANSYGYHYGYIR